MMGGDQPNNVGGGGGGGSGQTNLSNSNNNVSSNQGGVGGGHSNNNGSGGGGGMMSSSSSSLGGIGMPPSSSGAATVHLKILVPAVAAGAIIGKGGETIAQLQKDTGARVKMSKSNDFYPGTSERVCLISGLMDGVLRIHEFIMEKIKEKPDPNAKMAIDFDHKQPAEREKQVKILVPNSTAGMIIGKGGQFITQIKDESGAYVQISQKSKDHALAERCITVIGEPDCNKKAVNMILSKVVEDPQSGSCLNVSYADVSGPVANFNPTGSPYASPSAASVTSHGSGGSIPGSHSGGGGNHPYSGVNGSINNLSMSPQLSSGPHGGSFSGGHGGHGSMQSHFGGPSSGNDPMGPHPGQPSPLANNSTQMIESLKAMLRVSGYTEEAVTEIATAMNTLANYGMLGLGLGLGQVFNGSMNGPPTQMMTTNPNAPNAANCNVMGGAGGQSAIYSSSGGPGGGGGGVDSIVGGGSNPSVTPGMGGGGGFGAVGTGGGNADGGGFPSPTGGHGARMVSSHADRSGGGGGGYDPFDHRHTSPNLGSPGITPQPGQGQGDALSGMNDNTFGLGMSHGGDHVGMGFQSRKSPTPTSGEGQHKLEVEVSDNIVGAILGHGGKSLVEIQRVSGATIQISKKGCFAPGTRNRIVTISGNPNSVSTAQYLIEQQIQDEERKRRENATGAGPGGPVGPGHGGAPISARLA